MDACSVERRNGLAIPTHDHDVAYPVERLRRGGFRRSLTAICTALLLIWGLSVGVARAEGATGDGAPKSADDSPIAPASPGASVQDVDETKKTAKAAALTPILP